MRLFIPLILTLLFQSLSAQKPEWNSEKGARLKSKCEEHLTETLLIYQDDQIVFSYGNPQADYKIFSIRKSLVSLLYGIYSSQGKIDLNATLADLEIDDIGGLTPTERQASVTNLLQATSGVYHAAAFETPGMVKKRPERGSHPPGTYWYYNNWDFNALTTIFEQETGKSIFDAFDKCISKPLGLEDFSVEDQQYVLEKERSLHPATLWRLSGRDLLKVGIMLLNEGIYNDTEVVPNSWIEQSMKVYSDLGMFGGYGFCWWVAKNGQHYPFVSFPDGTFSARGTGMQDLIVVPEYNMVIVHQTDPQGPDDEMMKVTNLGRMLKIILDQ